MTSLPFRVRVNDFVKALEMKKSLTVKNGENPC